MKSKDERYMAVAKACLKVLTSQSVLENDKQSNIDKLYYAIDDAFANEFKILLEDYNRLETALREIAALDEGKNPEAVALAKKAFAKDSAIH